MSLPSAKARRFSLAFVFQKFFTIERNLVEADVGTSRVPDVKTEILSTILNAEAVAAEVKIQHRLGRSVQGKLPDPKLCKLNNMIIQGLPGSYLGQAEKMARAVARSEIDELHCMIIENNCQCALVDRPTPPICKGNLEPGWSKKT
jgi:hypothetical protein